MTNANLTHHAARRLQQRCIREDALMLLFEYGRRAYDHHGMQTLYFDKRARRKVAKAIPEDELRQMKAFGTYAVVDGDDCVVTVGHRTQRIHRH